MSAHMSSSPPATPQAIWLRTREVKWVWQGFVWCWELQFWVPLTIFWHLWSYEGTLSSLGFLLLIFSIGEILLGICSCYFFYILSNFWYTYIVNQLFFSKNFLELQSSVKLVLQYVVKEYWIFKSSCWQRSDYATKPTQKVSKIDLDIKVAVVASF